MVDTPQGGMDSSPCVQQPHALYVFPVYLYILGDICKLYGQDASYVGGLGVSAHLSGFWCLSVHPLDVHYAFILYLSCSLLCLKSTSTAMTTTPTVNVVSSGMSSLSSVTVALSLMGLPTMLGQNDVVLLPSLTPRCSGGIPGIASVPQQQPPSAVPLQAYANYAMGSPEVGFFGYGHQPTPSMHRVAAPYTTLSRG